MFKLRDQHIEAFTPLLVDAFEIEAVEALRQRLPDQTGHISDDELHPFVRRGMLHSFAYGLMENEAIMAFLMAAVVFGERFDEDPEHPWALPLLMDPDHTPMEKADFLVMKVAAAVAVPDEAPNP